MMEITQSDASYAQRALDYMRSKAAFAKSLEIPAIALDKTLELMVKVTPPRRKPPARLGTAAGQ